jgi:hypothetical protein
MAVTIQPIATPFWSGPLEPDRDHAAELTVSRVW